MKFIESYDVALLAPADYNPRRITEEAFEKLKESIAKFGIVKPVIVSGSKNTLTAGHQRTKAMKALGVDKVPVVMIKEVSLQDEIKFNLFHNSIETNKSKSRLICDVPFGYSVVPWDQFESGHNDNAVVIKEICGLIVRYGEWGSVIVDERGNVIQNSDYVLAAAMVKADVIVYKMANDKAREYLEYCNIDYGSYHYEALGVKSYNQLYCQMNRTAEGEDAVFKSALYEQQVLHQVRMTDRIIDFGAGKMEYVRVLKGRGHKAFGYEPHLQKKDTRSIDINQVIFDILMIEKDVAKNGLFDVVILDSVLNSIINPKFEHYVLTTCNALLSKDGTFFAATRNLREIEGKLNCKKVSKTATQKRALEFLDNDNFSATFRSGVWTMQKFHTWETLHELLSKYFKEVEIVDKTGAKIHAKCRKPKNLDLGIYAEAISEEFNMEYPGGYRHNKSKKLVDLLLELLERRSQ